MEGLLGSGSISCNSVHLERKKRSIDSTPPMDASPESDSPPSDNLEDEETPEVDKDYAANAIFLKKLMSLDDGTRQRIGHW